MKVEANSKLEIFLFYFFGNLIFITIINLLFPKNYFFKSDIVDSFVRTLTANMFVVYIYFFYQKKRNKLSFRNNKTNKIDKEDS